MTAKARFTAADVARAVSGAAKGGMIVGRVEVWPNGKIVVVPAGWVALDRPNPLDRLLNAEPPALAVERARATAKRLQKHAK